MPAIDEKPAAFDNFFLSLLHHIEEKGQNHNVVKVFKHNTKDVKFQKILNYLKA